MIEVTTNSEAARCVNTLRPLATMLPVEEVSTMVTSSITRNKRDYKAERLRRKKHQLTCLGCGVIFYRVDKRRTFCSVSCANKVTGNIYKKKHPTRICRGCGETFQPNSERMRRIKNGIDKGEYCTRECAYGHLDDWTKLNKKNPHRVFDYSQVYFPVCDICGKQFTIRDKKSHICSPECYKIYQRQQYRNIFQSVMETNEFIDKICRHCGKPFKVNFLVDRRQYCSDKCLERSHRRERRVREKKQFVCHIRLNDIYLRDGGKCQLCGGRIDRKIKPPHPMSLTLDHIIPLVRGGLHEPSNVQISHFGCNSKKGGKLIGQMRLCA